MFPERLLIRVNYIPGYTIPQERDLPAVTDLVTSLSDIHNSGLQTCTLSPPFLKNRDTCIFCYSRNR